ncbi:Mis12-Mtw1 protein family-domain-containing protein [Radiomyces spectabilis]|uniref:Mis12-Mtw1 protein family-domain-containing protein n=1 Tax=Radiomyces spectabilis TaxID=64574 RepID=UPI002220C923|nr:Mis12-Mtw1 protein family-domain-containing protein [Radiomyces spectabilis]KAI8388230.1 Mis12-Mtw1 protein family-domain-containing protein [Radiomyces spectabilis]
MNTPKEENDEGFVFKRRRMSRSLTSAPSFPGVQSTAYKPPSLKVDPTQEHTKSRASSIAPYNDTSSIPSSFPLSPESPNTLPPPPIRSSQARSMAGSFEPQTRKNRPSSIPFNDTGSRRSSIESFYFQDLPDQVPPDQYYTRLNPHMSESDRLRQLLIWSAQNLRNQNPPTTTNGTTNATKKSEQVVNKIVDRLQRKFIEKLKTGEIPISLHQPLEPNSTPLESKNPNPLNEHNKERIRKAEAKMAILKQELEAWRRYSNERFDEHAKAVDASASTKEAYRKSIEGKSLKELLRDADPEFQAFASQLSDDEMDEQMDMLNKSVEAIHPSVSELRQTMNTALQFQHESHQFTKKLSSALAQSLYEANQCIPPPSQRDALLDDEAKTKNRKAAINDILKLLSKKGQ